MISVIIPAHNEEKYIEDCILSVRAAEKKLGGTVEIIVVLNRCTDRTESIARSYHAKTIIENAKNLSIIRNAGIRSATQPIVVTIDADSRMSEGMLVEVKKRLEKGNTIGGGVANVQVDRLSLGIILTGVFLWAWIFWNYRISAGMFWFYKSDFDAVGGFNEKMLTVEDVDFAMRLKRRGRETQRPFSTTWRNHILTSARKFNHFGDWYILKNPKKTLELLRGARQTLADEFYYEFKH